MIFTIAVNSLFFILYLENLKEHSLRTYGEWYDHVMITISLMASTERSPLKSRECAFE